MSLHLFHGFFGLPLELKHIILEDTSLQTLNNMSLVHSSFVNMLQKLMFTRFFSIRLGESATRLIQYLSKESKNRFKIPRRLTHLRIDFQNLRPHSLTMDDLLMHDLKCAQSTVLQVRELVVALESLSQHLDNTPAKIEISGLVPADKENRIDKIQLVLQRSSEIRDLAFVGPQKSFITYSATSRPNDSDDAKFREWSVIRKLDLSGLCSKVPDFAVHMTAEWQHLESLTVSLQKNGTMGRDLQQLLYRDVGCRLKFLNIWVESGYGKLPITLLYVSMSLNTLIIIGKADLLDLTRSTALRVVEVLRLSEKGEPIPRSPRDYIRFSWSSVEEYSLDIYGPGPPSELAELVIDIVLLADTKVEEPSFVEFS